MHIGFHHVLLRQPLWFVYSVYLLGSNTFLEPYSATSTTELLRKELSGPQVNIHVVTILSILKYWLVFVMFLIYTFHLSSVSLYYFFTHQRNNLISCFQIGFYMPSFIII